MVTNVVDIGESITAVCKGSPLLRDWVAVGTVVRMTEEVDVGKTAAAACEKLSWPRDWLTEGLAEAMVTRVGYVTASTAGVCKRSTWTGDFVMVEFAILATGVVELGKLSAALCMIRGAASPKIRLRWLQLFCMLSCFVFGLMLWFDICSGVWE